uniref:Uncharacterized protein n=1 Tax=Acrobeloides nanus TaxID=290746 RepID=A0A914CYW1_9BILA
MFIGKIADILAKDGHEIVLYQPVVDENITTSGTKHARVIERPRSFQMNFTMNDMQED